MGTHKKVTPPGFEPRSSEPESDILSIELWGRIKMRLQKYIFLGKNEL